MATDLRTWLQKEQREFVIAHIKEPLYKAIIVLARRLRVEPTKETTKHPNSHTLIDIWDKFLAMENNQEREPLFRAVAKISTSKHEEDIYYQARLQVWLELWLEQVLAGKWKPRSPDYPNSHWKVDPNIRGVGYAFLKKCYYQRNDNVNSNK